MQNSGPSRFFRSSLRLTAGGLILAAAAFVFTSGCDKITDISPGSDSSCAMMVKPGPESNDLGPGDFNANYLGFAARMKPGERMVMKAQFPHARYISLNVYDEKLRPVDAIRDYEVAPSAGVNPFVPGAERSGEYIGEFEITVLMGPRPAGKRPANTLYAGIANDGTPNKAAFLGYRIYLVDKGLAYRDHHPLGEYGAVPPPRVMVYDHDGKPYCPAKQISKLSYMRGALSVLTAFLRETDNMKDQRGVPQSPVAWNNQYSREERQENVVVGNDDTIYISAAVDSRFGELLVLRWRSARTPEASYTGAPIDADVDMRYWSLTFAYRDPSYFAGFPTETSLSDVDVPRLENGDRRLVIGFSGMDRPDCVPKEQWVGLKMDKGIMIMRNIMISPDYPGDLGRLPTGPITGDETKYTPGGVYCSVEQLRQNPDIGLR